MLAIYLETLYIHYSKWGDMHIIGMYLIDTIQSVMH